jgi:serine/threonine protein kinase
MSYDNFELIKKIGSGSFGIVYLAENKKSKERIALKMYRESVKTDLVEECVELSLKLQHPNLMICSYFFYDRIITDNGPFNIKSTIHLFTVLEYIEGKSLYKMVKQDIEKMHIYNDLMPIDDENLQKHNKKKYMASMEKKMDIYLPQIISALQYLHSLNLTHCDIKHENILVHRDNIKIIDYDFLTKNVKIVKKGTPYFLSPEIYLAKNISEKIDIWALGITVYYCIKADYPFDAENQIELKELVLSNYTPDYNGFSPKYVKMISGMLSKDPLKRMNLTEILSLI